MVIILFFPLNRESKFCKENKFVPYSNLELGLVYLAQGNKEEAKTILDHTIKNYSKYYSENVVQIKAYAALRSLGVSTDKTADEPEVDIDELETVESNDDESSDSDDDEPKK